MGISIGNREEITKKELFVYETLGYKSTLQKL